MHVGCTIDGNATTCDEHGVAFVVDGLIGLSSKGEQTCNIEVNGSRSVINSHQLAQLSVGVDDGTDGVSTWNIDGRRSQRKRLGRPFRDIFRGGIGCPLRTVLPYLDGSTGR